MSNLDKTILFIVSPEYGHLLPTIQVALDLRQRHFNILYLTAGHFKEFLSALGFDLIEFMQFDEIDARYVSTSGWSYWYLFEQRCNNLRGIALKKIVCNVLKSRDIFGIVLDSMFTELFHSQLSHVMRDKPCVALGTLLPNWMCHPYQSQLPHVILCPASFEIGELRNRGQNLLYADPSIYLPVVAEVAPIAISSLQISALVTFGSQSIGHSELRTVLSVVCKVARIRRDIQFSIAIGSDIICGSDHFNIADLDNVIFYSKLPQVAVLRETDIFITHGGLGSIKEALLIGVPMIVIPRYFDQPFNAVRVEHHKVGMALFNNELSVNSLIAAIDMMLASAATRDSVEEFREIFSYANSHRVAAGLIEERLGADRRIRL